MENIKNLNDEVFASSIKWRIDLSQGNAAFLGNDFNLPVLSPLVHVDGENDVGWQLEITEMSFNEFRGTNASAIPSANHRYFRVELHLMHDQLRQREFFLFDMYVNGLYITLDPTLREITFRVPRSHQALEILSFVRMLRPVIRFAPLGRHLILDDDSDEEHFQQLQEQFARRDIRLPVYDDVSSDDSGVGDSY